MPRPPAPNRDRGDIDEFGKVPVDRFTGVLRVPFGEMLAYVHMGFGSVYAEELHIHVECGRVTGTRVYDNRGKEINTNRLDIDNPPGQENPFPGDRDIN